MFNWLLPVVTGLCWIIRGQSGFGGIRGGSLTGFITYFALFTIAGFKSWWDLLWLMLMSLNLGIVENAFGYGDTTDRIYQTYNETKKFNSEEFCHVMLISFAYGIMPMFLFPWSIRISLAINGQVSMLGFPLAVITQIYKDSWFNWLPEGFDRWWIGEFVIGFFLGLGILLGTFFYSGR